jgi:hypothetical protein
MGTGVRRMTHKTASLDRRIGIDERDHAECWRFAVKPAGSCNCVSYKIAGTCPTFSAEERVYPRSWPSVLNVFGIRLRCHPQRRCIFIEQNHAAPWRDKLSGPRFLPIVVTVGYRASQRISAIGDAPEHLGPFVPLPQSK